MRPAIASNVLALSIIIKPAAPPARWAFLKVEACHQAFESFGHGLLLGARIAVVVDDLFYVFSSGTVLVASDVFTDELPTRHAHKLSADRASPAESIIALLSLAHEL
ncbi:unnamed protein product [Zymoseptoria tritici ST99CH_1A5]|nr:unnamed protein product [Zymoseptoria tritici ST99CH_1E4]SMR59637.1 unnamed protein product [Zymoseptoria tritici ST99CH_3D1]SMY26830.1 unnamed protein product [Zymoseptoria tritici ST99CH_1A5]